ncbi:thermonuclease family protein [Bacillus sp. REN10]|uniref:thermonuclease family protein n=1 Tax=Bacillus sp. REN10 TaxID=2782541 RepID=UPI00193C14F7|nr:thermonuclease family protein [Bacillus sp. REN10]
MFNQKSKWLKPIVATALSLSLLGSAFAPFAKENIYAEAAAPKTAVTTKVTEVVDGDTIRVNYKGKKETVRLILVDTPETKDPKRCVQLYGPEASKFTKDSLLNKNIKLELGVQTRDKYGRILAYVYLNDKMFNQTLLEKGLARLAVYPPNTQYLDQLKKAEDTAKKKKLGIWSNTNAVNGGCTLKPAPKPTPVKPKPQPKPTKFKNCTEMRKVYPNGVKRGHPAYEPKHDRDNDGWACER